MASNAACAGCAPAPAQFEAVWTPKAPAVDESMSSEQLRQLSSRGGAPAGLAGDDRERYFESQGGKAQTLGLYKSQAPVSARIKGQFEARPGAGGEVCISIRKIVLEYDFSNPTVYLSTDLKTPCKRQVAWEHEMTHHKNHEYAVAAAAEEFKRWAEGKAWEPTRLENASQAGLFDPNRAFDQARFLAQSFLDRVAQIRSGLDLRLDNSRRSIEESLFCAKEYPESYVNWLNEKKAKMDAGQGTDR